MASALYLFFFNFLSDRGLGGARELAVAKASLLLASTVYQ